MLKMPVHKYRPFPPVDLPDRCWPTRQVTAAPIWCSVDLRDGNQALVEPMGIDRKMCLFRHLIELGFKEIEVGFPAASETDYSFVRHVIDHDLIPDDVTIQVLTQAREDLINRTFTAIEGARRAIVHLYNSTSTLQRRVVFGLDRAGVQRLATSGTALVKQHATDLQRRGVDISFEYSPESFSDTELDYALDVCHAVMEIWDPSRDRPIIFNLPATVEMATPNVYADQIEWMHRHLRNRDRIILSLHPHNDRGTATAAAELGLMAGADRIEGTLLGNGERTGNVDVVVLALNLLSQGIDPLLDLSDIDRTVEIATYCTRLPVHPRHPYVGQLVYTAFSGSHQDAIKKGMAAQAVSNSELWQVPYLPIDPTDVGRNYEAIIRVNSQSGKGGVAWILEREFGVRLPRGLQVEFSTAVQALADGSGEEVSPAAIWRTFSEQYLRSDTPFSLIDYRLETARSGAGRVSCRATLSGGGRQSEIVGDGTGPIDAFIHALKRGFGASIRVLDYQEHAIGQGSDVKAICYVEVAGQDGARTYGVGLDPNITSASLRAIVSGLNRLHTERTYDTRPSNALV